MRAETNRKNRIGKPGIFFLAYFIIITVIFLWNLFHCTAYSWNTADLFLTDRMDSREAVQDTDLSSRIELLDDTPLVMRTAPDDDTDHAPEKAEKKLRLRGIALLGYENTHGLKYSDETISVQVFNSGTGELVGRGALPLKYQTPFPNDETAVYIALSEPVTQMRLDELEIHFSTSGLTRNGIYASGDAALEGESVPYGRMYYEKKSWNPLMPILYYVLELLAGFGCLLLYAERRMPLLHSSGKESAAFPDVLLAADSRSGKTVGRKISLKRLALPIVLLMLVAAMMLYTYVHVIKKTAQSCDVDFLTGGSRTEEMITLEPGMTLRQNVTAGQNDLSGVGIMLAEKDKKSVALSKKASYADSVLEWKLLDETGTAALTSGSAQVKDLKKVKAVLGKDITEEKVLTAAEKSFVLPLERPVREAAGKRFVLEISMPEQDNPQEAVYLLATEETNGEISLEGTDAGENTDASTLQQGSIPLELELMGTYACNGFIKGMYLRVCAFVLVMLAALYYAARHFGAQSSSKQAAAMYLVSALCMGMVFSFLTPAYTISDERAHIDSVYTLSNSLLGIRDIPGPRRLLKRACDIDSSISNTMPVTAERYRVVDEGLFKAAPKSVAAEGSAGEDSALAGSKQIRIPTGRELTPVFNRDAFGNVPLLCYLPSAIGFSTARLLGRNMITMVMAARWLNLLVCIWIMYLAISRMPYGATAMGVVGLFPKMLQLMSSCSYDGMITAGIFLFISLSLAIAFGKKVSIADILALFLTGLYVAACKGGAYLPVLGIVLIIPAARAGKEKKQQISWLAICASTLGGAAVLFLGKYVIRLIGIFGRDSGTATLAAGTKTLYTLSDFIPAPVKLLRIYINTIMVRGDGLLGELVGKNLCQRWYFVYAFLLLALLGILRRNSIRQNGDSSEDQNHLQLRGRLCFLFLAAMSAALVFLSMLLAYTQKGSLYIDGLQGRYFLPICLLPLLAAENGLVHRDGIGDTAILYAADFILALTFCEILLNCLGRV